ncbi:unnamed protein product, partial [Laminaria digitata]
QKADAERIAAAEEHRAATAESLRRDAFLRDLDDRAEKGEATLTDIATAARGGVLDADDAAARMASLAKTLAERDGQAARAATAIDSTDTFLDPENADDRRAADVHWQDTVLPLVEDLPEPERIRFEDAVILNTGVAP